MYLFEITFFPDTCTEVGLLDHIVTLFLFVFFLGISILFSIVATSLNSHQQYRRVPFSPQPL